MYNSYQEGMIMETRNNTLLVLNDVDANILNKFSTRIQKYHLKNTVHLTYVVPIIPVSYLQIPSSELIAAKEESDGNQKLKQWAKRLNIKKSWLVHGAINSAIRNLVEELNIHTVVQSNDELIEELYSITHNQQHTPPSYQGGNNSYFDLLYG